MPIYLTLFRVGTRHARRLRVMLPKRGRARNSRTVPCRTKSGYMFHSLRPDIDM